MAQKTVSEFRRWVRGRAVKRWLAWVGGPSAILFIFVAVVVTIAYQNPQTLEDIGSNEVIMTSLLIFVAFLVVYLFYMGREPVIVYNEAENDRLKLQRRLSKINRTTPNIQEPNFGIEITPMRPVRQNQYGVEEYGEVNDVVERYYAEFQNKKKPSVATEDADNIYLNLSFHNTTKIVYQSDRPRWHGTYKNFDPTTWYPVINLRASGNKEQLYLVIRKTGEEDLYILGQESRGHPSFINPGLKLIGKVHYAHIELSSPNLDMIHYWVRIENKGRKGPEFTLLKKRPDSLKSTI